MDGRWFVDGRLLIFLFNAVITSLSLICAYEASLCYLTMRSSASNSAPKCSSCDIFEFYSIF